MIRYALVVVSLFAAASLAQAQTKTQNQVPFIPQTETSNQVLNGIQMANDEHRAQQQIELQKQQLQLQQQALAQSEAKPAGTAMVEVNRAKLAELIANATVLADAYLILSEKYDKLLKENQSLRGAATTPIPQPVVPQMIQRQQPTPITIPAPVNCTSHSYPWGTTTTTCY